MAIPLFVRSSAALPLMDPRFKTRDQRNPGWYWCQNQLIDKLAAKVGPYGVAVYNVLSRYSRNNRVTLSVKEISRTLRCGRSVVFSSLCALEKHGAIVREPVPGSESAYVLLDLKSEPIHQTDEPVHQADVSVDPSTTQTGPSATRTTSIHEADDTYPPDELLNKEERLKTEKNINTASLFEPANADFKDVWSRVLELVKPMLSATDFDTWLRPTHLIADEGSRLLIEVPNPYFYDVGRKFNLEIGSALSKLGRDETKVKLQAKGAA